jgi:hypothetical protein
MSRSSETQGMNHQRDAQPLLLTASMQRERAREVDAQTAELGAMRADV